jgi:hypothetical protein
MFLLKLVCLVISLVILKAAPIADADALVRDCLSQLPANIVRLEGTESIRDAVISNGEIVQSHIYEVGTMYGIHFTMKISQRVIISKLIFNFYFKLLSNCIHFSKSWNCKLAALVNDQTTIEPYTASLLVIHYKLLF